MIEKLFEKLDLKPEEARLYLSLLNAGPAGAGELAKRTGFKRPSVYVYLERLLNAGLIAQTMDGSIKHFTAEPTEKIRILYRQKIDELKLYETDMEKMLASLHTSGDMGRFKPRIKFFEGQEGVQNLLQDCWQHKNTEALTLWPIKSFQAALSEEFLYYHNLMRIKNNMSVKAIWEHDPAIADHAPPHLGSGKEYLREIRFAPKDMKFEMGYWLYADKAAFVSSRAENFGFLIESKELIQILKMQHAMIWNIAAPVEIKPKGARAFFEEYRKIL
jgi:HTH-type transcriptional regulator, sugar sensing transcriptional regulator